MKKDKRHLIEPLPKVSYVPDYESVFSSIQYPRVKTLPSDPQEHARLKLIGGQWLIWLHWVVKKKWLSKHKIPVPREVAKLYEPKGEYLYHLLEICIQAHSSQWGKPYNNNGLVWFSHIVKAERDANIRHILNNEADETYSQRGYGRAFRDDQRLIIAQLENLQNPWHPELSPHHHRLMAAALELEGSDRFVDDYWKPFLKAYRGWIRSLDSLNWVAAWVQDNHLKCQAGRGKGAIKII